MSRRNWPFEHTKSSVFESMDNTCVLCRSPCSVSVSVSVQGSRPFFSCVVRDDLGVPDGTTADTVLDSASRGALVLKEGRCLGENKAALEHTLPLVRCTSGVKADVLAGQEQALVSSCLRVVLGRQAQQEAAQGFRCPRSERMIRRCQIFTNAKPNGPSVREFLHMGMEPDATPVKMTVKQVMPALQSTSKKWRTSSRPSCTFSS